MTTPTLQVTTKPAADHAVPLLVDEEANIANHAAHQADDINEGRSFSSCLPVLIGFFFLTLNSATAIVRSRGDKMAVAFICFSYADLVAIFLSLRMYERAPASSAKRTWLKIDVWVETALLTFAFSGKIAAVMPAPVAVMVWLMAFATVAGGFVVFFVCIEKKGSNCAQATAAGGALDEDGEAIGKTERGSGRDWEISRGERRTGRNRRMQVQEQSRGDVGRDMELPARWQQAVAKASGGIGQNAWLPMPTESCTAAWWQLPMLQIGGQ
ncbi:unnamed protein product [Urochloa humidicola]